MKLLCIVWGLHSLDGSLKKCETITLNPVRIIPGRVSKWYETPMYCLGTAFTRCQLKKM